MRKLVYGCFLALTFQAQAGNFEGGEAELIKLKQFQQKSEAIRIGVAHKMSGEELQLYKEAKQKHTQDGKFVIELFYKNTQDFPTKFHLSDTYKDDPSGYHKAETDNTILTYYLGENHEALNATIVVVLKNVGIQIVTSDMEAIEQVFSDQRLFMAYHAGNYMREITTVN